MVDYLSVTNIFKKNLKSLRAQMALDMSVYKIKMRKLRHRNVK